jgi:hypothetical protein
MGFVVERSDCDYAPYYCEENVWRFLARPGLAGHGAWALMVCNAAHDLIMLRQRAGRPMDGLVHWDYHALALVEDPVEGPLALDFDSDLPFPCPLARYIDSSFPAAVQARSAPVFRLVAAADYVAGFSSDRSHMRKSDGSWMAPPPPWDRPGKSGNRPGNLLEWMDMGRKKPGRILSRTELERFAGGKRIHGISR